MTIRQFILKRGNTTVSSTYTGPSGEITYDTGLNAVRIHDGITPGGNLMPSGTLISVFQSNITALESNVSALYSNAAVQANLITALQNADSTSGPTPPGSAPDGALWYDSTTGRLYVQYDGFWIDASPENVYTLPVASNTVIGGVRIGDNLTIDGDGILTALPQMTLGNLTVDDQQINGTNINGNIYLAPNGTGSVFVPSLTLPVGSLVEETVPIEVPIENLTLDTVVDYSTGPGDTLTIGTVGNPLGIAHPWAIYRFTTTPAPALELDDVIGGAGVPLESKIIYVGTDAYSAYIVTNKVFPGAPPANGISITTVRATVNASLSISTGVDTDIALSTGGGLGVIVTHSDIVPITNNTYSLGTPTKRFQQLWLGGGTIYIADDVLGTDIALAASNGDLVVQGGKGLEVGEFRFRDNQLFLTNPATEILVGTTGATAPVTFKRTIQIRNSTDEYNLLRVDQQGRITVLSDIAADPTEAAMSIVGARTRDVQSPNNLGVLLQLTGTSAAPSRIYHDSYGAANYSAFIGRHARGNSLVSTQTLSGDIIARVGANPHDGTGFATISTMRMDFVNAETQTTSARGSKLEFWTTAIGSTTIGKRVTIDGSDIVLTAAGAGGITFADSSRQTTAWQGDTSLAGITANVTAANVNISTLFANAATQSTDIITLFANAATQSTDITTLFANAATQQIQITNLNNGLTAANANIATLFSTTQTFGPVVTALVANAATQQTQINSIATNAVNVVTAGTGVSVSRTNGTVGIDNTGVTTVAGTANRILVNGGTAAANAAITLNLPQDIAPSSTVTFANLTITGNLNIEGNIIASDNISLESKILYLANTATSGSELDGGGIILGNVNAPFSRSFLYDFNANAWNTDGAGLVTLDLNADNAYVDFLWNNGGAHFGGAYDDYDFPNAIIQSDSDANSYVQIVSRNHNSGTNASSDFVAVNDIGNDSSYYIDLGINSSSYNNPDYSINGANGGYLYINGGNLSIGTQTAGNTIKFHTSGTTESNLRVTINDDGLSTVGNISVGAGIVFADATYQTTSATTTINNFVSVFDANLGTVTIDINTLFSNAAAQQTNINTINANVTAANINISTLFANAASQAVDLTNLFSNAATQQTEINGLRANVTAANSAIVTANSAVVSYVNSVNTAMIANVNAANSAIITANTGMKSYVDAQDTAITNAWTANGATQQTEINALRANITAANSAIVTANSAVVSHVNSLNTAMIANVNAANSAIITANSAVVSYVNSLNTAMIANVNAANSAIVTANTGMKSYVDAAVTSSSLYAFGKFGVTGQTTVTATNTSDTANLVAGSGITITTSGKDITITSTATGGVSSLVGGNNIVLSGSTGAVTIQRVDGVQTVVTGNTASSYSVTTTDQYIGTARSATGTGTVTLPLGSTVPAGRQYIIKDEGGQSGNVFRRITVAASGSDTIDGSATRGITSNYGALTVLWTGTKWSVI